MELQQIQKEMELGQLTPHMMAEYRTQLAGKYARARDIWDELETRKFRYIRDSEEGSQKAKENAWEATEEGEQWRHWKSQMKKIEKMLSSLKTQLEVATGEALNHF